MGYKEKQEEFRKVIEQVFEEIDQIKEFLNTVLEMSEGMETDGDIYKIGEWAIEHEPKTEYIELK